MCRSYRTLEFTLKFIGTFQTFSEPIKNYQNLSESSRFYQIVTEIIRTDV